MKKKIFFIGQFPPPMHGLSKALDTLYNSSLNDKYVFEKLNLTGNKDILSIYRKIHASKCDLYYLTVSQTKGGNLRDLIIMKILRHERKKCLIHLHGGYYRELVEKQLPTWQKRENYKEISNLAGTIVLGNSLISNFSGMISDNHIYIVPNCVDDSYYPDDQVIQNKLKSCEAKPIRHVLYLSNFIFDKGYFKILEMAKLEKERFEKEGNQKFIFDFAGKFFLESDSSEFFNFIEDNQLDQFVKYHGVVNGKEKMNLLLSSDIFLLLTKYKKEGQPISILEAMANGCVVISTMFAGIPDIITNEYNGYLVNVDEQYSNIYELLFDVRYKDIVANARRTINEKYLQYNYINNMDYVFQKTLQ